MPKIPILTTENWNLWKAEVKMLLIREKLWAVVCGRDEKPETDGTTATAKKNMAEWEDKAERATATIFPFLDGSAKKLLNTEELMNPVLLWSKLKSMYEVHGFSATFVIWKRLLGAKSEDFGSVQLYVADIQENVQILRAAEYTLDDGLIAAVLLAGLPRAYDPFITSVTQSLRTDSVKIDTLIPQILDEATRVGGENGIKDLALHVHSKGPGCWHCGILGHKEATCWKKYPEKKPEAGEANVAL